MNKIVLSVLFASLGCLLPASESVLEIFEFGKPEPVVRTALSGSPQDFSGSGWSCRAEKMNGPIAGWDLRFTSPRHEPVRLSVRLTSPLGFTPKRFWDGNKERNAENLPLERREFLEAFPLASAEDGRTGRALGFTPDTILSGFTRALTSDGLVLEARIVVDDRRVQELGIVDFSFDPEFGWRNAVEAYQNASLKWFEPTPGVDPRIYGVSGYLGSAHLQREFLLHSNRKSRIEWEWTYAPWYESGNWYPPGEGWQGETNEYLSYYGHRKGKPITREEYHDVLVRQMQWGDKVAAMFYYILVKDIHQSVAKHYPDAVMPGTSGLHSLPSNAGKTKSAFAPGSPLFDYLKKQLKNVADHYEIAGFSFDMANSSYHVDVPSQLEYAVGRSWYDDGKIFTSDTVAPIPFSDYIHTLKRGDKTMGTMFNAALSDFSPFTFFHCDGAIMEGLPEYNVSMILPLRLIMGRKPLTFWHGNQARNPLLHPSIVDPEKKEKAELGFRQFYLLKCYEFGINPMNWISGGPVFQPHLSAIRALSEAGYHPVPAVKGSDPFWTGRFGDGEGTLLTFSNPKRETMTRTVRVINRYLGSGTYGFIPQTGKLDQKFADGETVFELTLEPKEVVVLRTVTLKGNISGLSVSADEKSVTLQADAPFEFTLPSADLAGRRIDYGKKFISGKTEKSVELPLLPACGIFASEDAMVAFLAPERTPALEAGAARDVRIAAEMTSLYRPTETASLRRFGKLNGNAGFLDAELAKPDLVISEPGSTSAGSLKICVGTPEDFPGFKIPENFPGPFLVMPDPNTLWIGGATPEQVRKAALVYFDMLDREWSKREKKR